MQLNQQTDFAFRLLMYLADQSVREVETDDPARPSGKPAALPTIRGIADYFGISYNHLMKVANALAARGYIKARRGKGGGLTLARPAGSISLGAVARDMEGHWDLVECFNEGGDCRIAPSCRLAPILGEALDAFWGVLDRYSLADIAHLPPDDLPLTFHRHAPRDIQ
ncbi:MAG: RrF2 family transcriptional regulator [Guyparkeria sp.]|uniref:RrF2 family transcriptional regulator n=1 Tax=Guyparkeria sp. TaxID=2035736 RepID=UPI0039781245